MWRLYESGLTCKGVGRAVGCSATVVYRRLSEAGYSLRIAGPRGPTGPRLRLTARDEAQVLLLADRGLSPWAIGRRVRRATTTVRRVLARAA